MNDRSLQHLSDAFTSIISMMLAAIRARGWRCLRELPMLVLAVIELHRMGREFAATMATLMAELKAGTLIPPAPEPWPALPQAEYACSPSPEAPRPAARPDPAPRDRQQRAARPSPPAADAEPDRPRTVDRAYPVPTLPHARGRAAGPPRPFAVFELPADAIPTGRSC